MRGESSWARGCACIAVMTCACGQEALFTEAECEAAAPGHIVVTEVLANPDGVDGDREYVELFNTTDVPLNLDGISLAIGKADGSVAESHRFFGAVIEARGYFVIGNTLSEPPPELIDYSYGDALGNLRNSDGAISIWCGETLIDRVTYESAADGRALELDGRLTPDDRLNDEPANWCAGPEGAGTPGGPNRPCERTPIDGSCLEDGAPRTVMRPLAEHVQITEWMANPAGPDEDLEWVEVRFDRVADLNGFQLGPAPDALEVAVDREECVPVDAGARVVFGASPNAAPRVDAELDFSLGNSGMRAIVAAVGGVVLDRVEYDGATEGFAWQLGSEGGLCEASEGDVYAPSNFGTPGAPNRACPVELAPGACLDQGLARPIVSPGIGEAHVVEWMPNPSAVDNRDGEWVEVRLDVSADLNGLSMSDLTGSKSVVESRQCLEVEAGAHVVFVRNTSASENGGIEGAVAELSLSLNNRDETITLEVDGEVLDTVTYARSEPGAATQIDDFGRVCTASSPYGDGDLGTPGVANPQCL